MQCLARGWGGGEIDVPGADTICSLYCFVITPSFLRRSIHRTPVCQALSVQIRRWMFDIHSDHHQLPTGFSTIYPLQVLIKWAQSHYKNRVCVCVFYPRIQRKLGRGWKLSHFPEQRWVEKKGNWVGAGTIDAFLEQRQVKHKTTCNMEVKAKSTFFYSLCFWSWYLFTAIEILTNTPKNQTCVSKISRFQMILISHAPSRCCIRKGNQSGHQLFMLVADLQAGNYCSCFKPLSFS